MPSYTQYKRQMAVLDADDSEIESWITVRGNHIPIMKGQSKGDAVKAFIESKNGGGKSATPKKDVYAGTPFAASKLKNTGYGEALKAGKNKVKLTESEAEAYRTKQSAKYDPAFEIDRKNALANYYLYGGKYTQRSKQAAYKEWKHDTSSEENLRAANKWVNSELVAKQSKPSDSSKGGKKETKKYPQDLVDMAHSVMAYGGFGMKPEDILNDSYHGQYLKRYTEKYGKELVLETLKEMASRIDRVDHNVYTGSEGETYNSVIWKAPQLETLPDEEWEATLKKLYKDRGSEKKLSKPSDASGAGAKKSLKDNLDDILDDSQLDFSTRYDKLKNLVEKHYSIKKIGKWESKNDGIQFFANSSGKSGTTSEMSIDKELGDYILNASSFRQDDVLTHLKNNITDEDGWQTINTRDLLNGLKNTKPKNGKYTFQVKTSYYDMYHD